MSGKEEMFGKISWKLPPLEKRATILLAGLFLFGFSAVDSTVGFLQSSTEPGKARVYVDNLQRYLFRNEIYLDPKEESKRITKTLIMARDSQDWDDIYERLVQDEFLRNSSLSRAQLDALNKGAEIVRHDLLSPVKWERRSDLRAFGDIIVLFLGAAGILIGVGVGNEDYKNHNW